MSECLVSRRWAIDRPRSSRDHGILMPRMPSPISLGYFAFGGTAHCSDVRGAPKKDGAFESVSRTVLVNIIRNDGDAVSVIVRPLTHRNDQSAYREAPTLFIDELTRIFLPAPLVSVGHAAVPCVCVLPFGRFRRTLRLLGRRFFFIDVDQFVP